MKVYIATTLSRLEDQRSLAVRLNSEFGVEQTFDWTRNGTLAGNPYKDVAEKEVAGVREADFVVVLLPAKLGAHTELGVALACGKKVFIYAANDEDTYCGNPYKCVFYEHPLVTQVISDNTEDLVRSIVKWIEND